MPVVPIRIAIYHPMLSFRGPISAETIHLDTDRQFISFIFPQVETMSGSVRVAVIGAGISGVVTAGHLLAAGIQVMVFERNNAAGGVW